MHPAIQFLKAGFPYAGELVTLCMAIEGAMKVRTGPNKKNNLNWFHALSKSMMASFAGAIFTKMFMGMPTSLFANDLAFGSALVAFAVVNYFPFDLGYKVLSTFPAKLTYTVFSHLFRASAVMLFSDLAYNVFKAKPSAYYPIPVFGPILFPSVLGNMGGFFANGFDGHLQNGMPFAFQIGFFASTFYHFYTHDENGIIGTSLRLVVKPLAVKAMLALGCEDAEASDNALFASSVATAFIILMSVLRLPEIFGTACNPFNASARALGIGYKAPKLKLEGGNNGSQSKSKQNKSKNKKKTN